MIQYIPINLTWGKIPKENPDRIGVIAARRFFEILNNIIIHAKRHYVQQCIAKIGAGPWNFCSSNMAASIMGRTRSN